MAAPRTSDPTPRVAGLEADLERLRAQRANDADELAEMLVTVAAAERARAAAETRAAQAQQVADTLEQELDRARARAASRETELNGAREELSRRAEALDRARADREVDRARYVELEGALERARREHTVTLESMSKARFAAADRERASIVDALESGSRARQRAAEAEADVSRTQQLLVRASSLLDEMDRREEMATAMRARAIDRLKRILAGELPPEGTEAPRSGERRDSATLPMLARDASAETDAPQREPAQREGLDLVERLTDVEDDLP